METFDELDRAIGTVSFDSEALLARAVTQGRRTQRRRRVAAGAAVAAVGALAVVPGVASLGGDHGDSSSDHPAGSVPVSPQQASAHLAKLLPGPSKPKYAQLIHGNVFVERTFESPGSGGGTAGVAVVRAHHKPFTYVTSGCRTVHRTEVQNGTASEYDCVAVAGGFLFTYFERPRPGRLATMPRGKADVRWTAKLVRPDDTSISVDASNHLPGQQPKRRTPVLDRQQLERLAQDPGWFRPAS